jgi:hypothetical protein
MVNLSNTNKQQNTTQRKLLLQKSIEAKEVREKQLQKKIDENNELKKAFFFYLL